MAEEISDKLHRMDLNSVSLEHHCESMFAFVKDQVIKVKYKGNYEIKKETKDAFELQQDGNIEDNLLLIREQLMSLNVLSGVSDRKTNEMKYAHPWGTTIWMPCEQQSRNLARGREYSIELTGCEVVPLKDNSDCTHRLNITYHILNPVSLIQHCESMFAFVKDQVIKVEYKGNWDIMNTKTGRDTFELQQDGNIKDKLLLMKKLLASLKVWSGVSDPDMDGKTYRATTWISCETNPQDLHVGSEYSIKLTGCEVVPLEDNPDWTHCLNIKYQSVNVNTR